MQRAECTIVFINGLLLTKFGLLRRQGAELAKAAQPRYRAMKRAANFRLKFR
jgi:hypothetical protein